MKLNLRVLIYLNPSNVDKVTHKFNLSADSGFIFVKNSILALNEVEDWHFYVLVPPENYQCWPNKPQNVTLVKYPYVNDALNSRFHFDTNALSEYFNTYRHDIDLIWTMLPEHAGALRAFANKRREEIPVFSYINWLDYKDSKGYEPSYIFRLLDGWENSHMIGIQSDHMLKYMKNELLSDYKLDYSKARVITPKTVIPPHKSEINDNLIGFPHRVSTESRFEEMASFIFPHIKGKLWVSNINGANVESHEKLLVKSFESHENYYKFLSTIRFGISYHIGYSMWSMSVLDMMACGKVVLAPNKNAFPEMFHKNYPFLFNNKEDFLKKLEYLQNCQVDELKLWGDLNRQIVEEKFTWKIQAKQLSEAFCSLLTDKKTPKTQSVLEAINEYGKITKSDLINKNITDYGRQCSRAWNKTRIELMRDYGIKDIHNSEHTTFVSACNNPDEMIQRRPSKIPTKHDLRKFEENNNQPTFNLEG